MNANSSSKVGRWIERAASSTDRASLEIIAIAPSSATPVRSSCRNGKPPRIIPRYTRPKTTSTVAVTDGIVDAAQARWIARGAGRTGLGSNRGMSRRGTNAMIEIDGAHGEGGGQLVRTAVAVSAVTG